MPTSIGLFCKSFAPDVERVLNLCKSVDRHNVDGLPLYIAVPRDDIPRFREIVPGYANLLDEKEFMQCSLNKRLPGWRDQQVAKLMFGVGCPVDNFLVLDSDCEFIRDFRADDFLRQDGLPLVATENYYRYRPGDRFSEEAALGLLSPGQMAVDRMTFVSASMFAIDRSMIGHRDLLKRKPTDTGPLIGGVFGRTDRVNVYFMPTPVIWSREIIEHFWWFLRERGLSFSDLILYAPWEAIWYGHYALTRFRDRIRCVEPYAMHFVSDADIAHAKDVGVSRETLSKNFLAVTLAARHQEAVSF